MISYNQISKVSKRVCVLTPPPFYSYLYVGEDLAIIDTGPKEGMIPWVPPSYPIILNSIDLLSFDKSLVKWILITQAGPDHIGGLKNLLDELPNATVATSKSNMEEIEKGLKLKKKLILEDGDEIDLKGTRIKVVYTPGHSEGETSYYEINDEAIACSDAVGFLYLRDKKVMIPAPFYNIRLCFESIKKIRNLKPKILLSGHNGVAMGNDIKDYLFAGEKALILWERMVISELKEQKTLDELDQILMKKLPEVSLCPNPNQTSWITKALTRILESEGKIVKEIIENKVYWKKF